MLSFLRKYPDKMLNMYY